LRRSLIESSARRFFEREFHLDTASRAEAAGIA